MPIVVAYNTPSVGITPAVVVSLLRSFCNGSISACNMLTLYLYTLACFKPEKGQNKRAILLMYNPCAVSCPVMLSVP